jgi:Zn-dependent protease with chaperone function
VFEIVSPIHQESSEASTGPTYALAEAPKATGFSAAKSTGATSRVQEAAPEPPKRTPAEILGAFRGEIAPVRPTLPYRMWAALVAVAMVLLPLLYLAIIAAVGYGLYYHATHNHVVFQNVRSGKAAFVAYVGPLFAGGVLLAFMVKPLFAAPGSRHKSRALDPSKEPLLFAFVDGVCASVGAPTPKRIDVDCQVNASASFERGGLGLLGNNLVLTIGLPLVAGLDLRQFAGVLAHEFGHFSQRGGMRLSYIIRSINMWFARVVYERDSWDEALGSWSGAGNVYLMILVGLARVVVWLTRRVLWVLMMAGHIISSFLLRQMEFDADRYEARMVGSATFESTARRLGVLNLAVQGAHADLSQSWSEGHLADNLPRLIEANVAQIPAPVLAAVDESIARRKTGLFDTHPADQDRIASARAEDTDGIFHLGGPATDVFRSFDALARAATFDYYKALFGPTLSKDVLQPYTELVREVEGVQEGHRGLGRFFLGQFTPMRPLALPAEIPAAPDDLKAARAALTSDREVIQAGAKQYQGLIEQYRTNAERTDLLAGAALLFKTNFKVKAAAFELPAATVEAAESEMRRLERERNTLVESARPFESSAAHRLAAALSLLERDDVAARIDRIEPLRQEARALYAVAAHLGSRVLVEFPTLIEAQRALLNALGRYSGNENNERLHNAIRRGAQALRDRLEGLSWKVGDSILYPFDHARGEITLAQYALPPAVPDKDDIRGLLEAADAVVGKLAPLYSRIIGRLVTIAEEAEKAVGLPPLEPAGEAG